MDEQIKPVAWKCVWIADGDGCDWEQYHDEDDPMPERWEDAPDEITPLYSQQSIDALRAEVERLQSSYDQLYVHAESSYQARKEAEAEAEALRADAERYRWLRRKDAWMEDYLSTKGAISAIFVSNGITGEAADTDKLDAAIDAARKGE